MGRIALTYNDKEYRLEFTRNSVRQMEASGFNINAISDSPVTMIPLLFQGAFIANNKGIKRKTIDDIFESIGNKTELIAALAEMYAETVNSLVEDKETNEGNVSWKVE